jgi:hypothetical protein
MTGIDLAALLKKLQRQDPTITALLSYDEEDWLRRNRKKGEPMTKRLKNGMTLKEFAEKLGQEMCAT